MKNAINFIGIVLIGIGLISCKKLETPDSTKELTVLSRKNKVGVSALPDKPNVLFIVVDDLRYTSVKRLFEEAGLEPADPAHGNRGNTNNMVPKTPKIDALIDGANAVTFTNAHASAVECSPSRTALLFGKYPHESGVYRNGNNWWTGVTDGNALTRQFVQDSKYKVFGAGKVFHNGPSAEGKYFNSVNAVPPYNNFRETTSSISGSGYSTIAPSTDKTGYEFQVIKLNNPSDDFSLDPTKNVTEDAKAVTFCINKMQSVVDQNVGLPASGKSSFFVACGLRRPHSPLIVPDNYFTSANTAVTPKVLPVDTAALPPRAKYLINNNPSIGPDVLRQDYPSDWGNYLRAYAGAVSYSDAQIGRLIDFIDANPVLHDNTIIVLISDHGFHLGDKHHLKKTTLYEETTRVPMIWRVPGQGVGDDKYCRVPVDLMSIYPTLMDYCNLTYPPGISGRNIRNLITNPGTSADPSPSGTDVALTEMDQKSSSIRTVNYRFTQYNDGGPNGLAEELYNHRGTAYSFDPWEARDLRNKSPEPTLLKPLRNKKNILIPNWAPMVSGGIANE
ncbi:sulfatase-like hydrolase/transferase [Daejeonella sp.]|uniref:sulfatase-like hydrolase/transferase n=1 Tax=Daejeonella sp. TaxID=2805397 RepID=UPI0030C14CF2